MKQASNASFIRTKRKQKGAVVVEMALVLPLFAMLLLGAFEFGSMAHDHQTLQNAAREGARFSALATNRISGASDPAAVLLTIQNRVVAYLQNEQLTVAPADVIVDQAYPIPVGALTVMGSHITINYQRPLIFPGATTLIGSATLQLQGNAIFRNFY
jgi:hypothetical protein